MPDVQIRRSGMQPAGGTRKLSGGRKACRRTRQIEGDQEPEGKEILKEKKQPTRAYIPEPRGQRSSRSRGGPDAICNYIGRPIWKSLGTAVRLLNKPIKITPMILLYVIACQ